MGKKSGRHTFYRVSGGIAAFFGIAILLFMFEPKFVPQAVYDVFGTAIFGSGFLYFALYAFLPFMIIFALDVGAGKWGTSFFSKDRGENDR